MPTYAFAGGVDAIPGWGQRNRVRFLGTWVEGDTWSITFATNIDGDFVVGQGQLADASYSYILIDANRVFLANGTYWSFSAIGDPTKWEIQDVGAGFNVFSNSYGVGDEAVSLAIIQGRIAVFGRYHIQIWQTDADPSNFARVQILQNTGTVARESVQSIGELDVLYLDDTGIRSLRTKETTLNAFVDDVGAPIDTIIQEVLNGISESTKAASLSVVEPESKRYWLALNNKIYVLSSFPSSKIRAWSTYLLTFENELGTQSPIQAAYFKVFRGKVYVAASDTLFFVYGGDDGVTYDTAIPAVDLPWIAMDKPATNKQVKGLQAAFSGKWKIYASTQPGAADMTEVVSRGSAVTANSLTDSTYNYGTFPYSAYGSHVHLRAVGEAAPTRQVLSMLTLLYDDANKK